MNKSLVIGSILTGIVMFVVSSLLWGGLHCYNGLVLHRFSDETKVARVIRDNAPHDGVYIIKGQHRQEGSTPLVIAGIRLEGKRSNAVQILGRLLVKIIAIFIAGWLVLKYNIRQYKERVRCLSLIGVLIAFPIYASFYFKGYYPLYFSVVSIAVIMIQWVIASLIMAKVIKA